MFNFRLWLSRWLFSLGLAVIPDEKTKHWMRIGLVVGAEGVLNDLEPDGS